MRSKRGTVQAARLMWRMKHSTLRALLCLQRARVSEAETVTKGVGHLAHAGHTTWQDCTGRAWAQLDDSPAPGCHRGLLSAKRGSHNQAPEQRTQSTQSPMKLDLAVSQ